ncbi:uncharacterized protein IL334_006764 [Kwoniella shivajii]|uniref:DHHA2 domain-containing protein n=1 Tax=Kwoniella shivajii TaxID=564305 RepID=A0ABZ1D6U3_9TREE|nr:hypothetical protein IL334_006764 [Kwoniella shivajii]
MRLPRNSRLLCFLLSLSFIPPFILVFSLLAWLDESMKICLPFSLNRISTQAHQSLSCQAKSYTSISSKGTGLKAIMSEVNGDGISTGIKQGNGNGKQQGKLAGFLTSQKETFLDDLKKGNGNGWTVVMGNEAGDLDSIASSISYAYLSAALTAQRSVPLILTPANLMKLRPENLLAFELSSFPVESLLHPEQLPISTTELSSLGVKFGLVDHNRLLPPFGDHTRDGTVESIIDHHEDEHSHLDAEIREIQIPTGSSASLVTKHFMKEWKSSLSSSPAGQKGSPIPSELATLLLSAILIDTTGLKPDRKATETDYQAASFLYPISTLSTTTTPNPDNTSAVDSQQNGDGHIISFSTDGSNIPQDLTILTEKLQDTKMDVSSLTTSQLLLRDYKEYSLPTSSSEYPTLKIGLSTVPLGFKKWLSKEPNGFESLLEETNEYMEEKTLDIEGILTSFKNGQGKSRRELALIVRRSGGVIKSHEQANKVLKELKKGLETNSDLLDLSKWDKDNKGAISAWENHNDQVVFWKQGNVKSTRKQVAPILRDLVASLN